MCVFRQILQQMRNAWQNVYNSLLSSAALGVRYYSRVHYLILLVVDVLAVPFVGCDPISFGSSLGLCDGKTNR